MKDVLVVRELRLRRWHMDERREVFPVGPPDLEDLEEFWLLDAKHPTDADLRMFRRCLSPWVGA